MRKKVETSVDVTITLTVTGEVIPSEPDVGAPQDIYDLSITGIGDKKLTYTESMAVTRALFNADPSAESAAKDALIYDA